LGDIRDEDVSQRASDTRRQCCVDFSQMTSDGTFSDLRTAADDLQDEFARFQSDVQRAIEPLQNQIILHDAQSSWQEQLRQAGHAVASPRRQTIFSVGTMIRVGVVSIGVAIAAISAERLLGTDLTVNHSFARFFEAPPPGAPTNPSDFSAPPDHAALASPVQSAEGERGTLADQTMRTQTSPDAAPQPQPAELPSPPPTANDRNETGPSRSAEAGPSSIDTTVPAPADVSGSSAVTTLSNDELERFRKFSEEQANRDKVRTPQDPSSSKRIVRQKALRHRRAQTAGLALSSRNQSDRKDLGGEARQSVRSPR
jgi:hypothetical protein